MGDIVITTEDLSEHPGTVEAPENIKTSALAIGDLHGNAMKAIYFLIRYGVMKLADEAHYATLLAIYNTSVKELTKVKLNEFATILDGATITPPYLITFIGDELADRGNNDWFTLLVMNKLHKNNVNYKIQLSNHSRVALESFSNNAPLPGILGSVHNNQQRSLDNLWILKENGLITEKALKPLVDESYKQHLLLIGYDITSDGNLTLFTHAPVGLETVRGLAKKFKINYDDSTIDKLILCIDQINEQASKAILANTFDAYHDVNDGDTKNNPNPLTNLLWARELRKDFTLTPTQGKFTVKCVHGHVGEGKSLNNNLHNTDSYWGQLSGDNKGKCLIYCEVWAHDPVKNYIQTCVKACDAYIIHLAQKTSSDTLSELKHAIITNAIKALNHADSNDTDKINNSPYARNVLTSHIF